MPVRRRYSSPIRETQARETRERVLAAAHDLLSDTGLDGFTLPKVAAAAGVSVPTVYRNFPTLEDLLRAYLAWIRPRLGQTPERLLESGSDAVARLPLDNYPRFEAHGAALRALMDSRVFNEIRAGSTADRARRGAAALRERAPGWTDADLEGAAGAIYALASPQTWRWLRDTWGLDADRASRAAAWAMGALIDALGTPPRKSKGRKR